eukprot:scaffold470_cov98-Cylindrotheca_fusiformis.AAC.3
MPKSRSITQPDVERGISSPQKGKNADRSVSPAKTEPLSPMSNTIDIDQRDAPRGLFGMTRAKTFMVCGVYLVLIGGLIYFVLNWLEIPGLNEQIDRLKGEVDRLEAENERYSDLNDQLNVTVRGLDETADELNITVTELNASANVLSGEVEELRKINSDLRSISDFLNSTANKLDKSYNEIKESLVKHIEANKVLTMARYKNQMQGRITNWQCNFGARFRTEAFANILTLDIPASSWTEVSGYVSERVLEELCLDDADFERFLQEKYSSWNAKNLFQAVSAYTETAFDWYFPNEGEDGLTPDDWSKANFDCQQLTTNYRMYGN